MTCPPRKIIILSDLHIEFGAFSIPPIENEKETIVILAGDIGVAKENHTYKSFIHDTCERFHTVIWILGNHEHYHSNFCKSKEILCHDTRSYVNLHIAEKETVIVDDYAFICATLWTNIRNKNANAIVEVGHSINDFKLIATNDSDPHNKILLTPDDTIIDFEQASAFIFQEINVQHDNNKIPIVVTHHGPSYLSVHPRFASCVVNAAFVSNLDADIIRTKPRIWIHGHTHDSFDYQIGDTRVIANPRGYISRYSDPENALFNPTLTISCEL